MTYKEVPVDWKPVFHLYYHTKYGKIEGIDPDKIQSPVYKLKKLYPLEASKEIWEHVMALLVSLQKSF